MTCLFTIMKRSHKQVKLGDGMAGEGDHCRDRQGMRDGRRGRQGKLGKASRHLEQSAKALGEAHEGPWDHKTNRGRGQRSNWSQSR